MTSSDSTTTPPHSQWVANEFRLNLRLSADSLKHKVPFFALITMQGGFVIPTASTFAIISSQEGIITVQISIRNFASRPKDHIAFGTCSDLQHVSTVCSKLNMADALGCKITATLIGKNDVSFSILPSSENAEKKLTKFFSIYEE